MLSSRVGAAVVCAAGLLGLAACGQQSSPADSPTDSPAGSSTAQSTTAAETSTETSKSTKPGKADKGVAEAKKTFGSLAPAELFAEFESCMPNGVADSMACSGVKVGQFQFFASDAKAASTTQLLTELRSSRIVEDEGDRIVGWSTLGNMAIVTVVDNRQGLVMQQLVSADKQDPEKRIYELGLAEKKAATTTSEAAAGEATTGEEENATDAEPSVAPSDEAASKN